LDHLNQGHFFSALIKKGWGFHFLYSSVPYYSKAVREKPPLTARDFAERLLRGIRVRYVFRSAYLRNGFDKLFGYQYHL